MISNQGDYQVSKCCGYLFMWAREHRKHFEQLSELASQTKEVFKPELLHLLADLELLQDDRRFIETCLAKKPSHERKSILNGYRQQWLAAGQ